MRQRDLETGKEYIVMVKGRRCRAIFIDFLDDRRDRNTRRMPTYLFRGLEEGYCSDIVVNHSKWIYETDQIAPATHECNTCHALWRLNLDETFTLVTRQAGKYCCDNVVAHSLIPLRHWGGRGCQDKGNTG